MKSVVQNSNFVWGCLCSINTIAFDKAMDQPPCVLSIFQIALQKRVFSVWIEFIDFYGMSTFLELFYALNLGNCVYSIFLFILVSLFKHFYTLLCDIKYSNPIKIICMQLNGLKYSYPMLIIIGFQVIISI